MRKQALVHLHQLCYLMAERVEEECDGSTEAFDMYHERDVNPHAIHLDKRTHQNAMTVLAEGIVETITIHDRSPTSTSSSTADAPSTGSN